MCSFCLLDAIPVTQLAASKTGAESPLNWFSVSVLTAIFQMNLGLPFFIGAKDDASGW